MSPYVSKRTTVTGTPGRAPALLKAGPLTNPCLTNRFFIKELEPRCCSRLTPDRRDHWG